MARKQSLKHQLSYKENVRDLEIYNFIEEEIKDTLGISTYLKILIEKDELFLKYLQKKRSI